VNAIQIIYLIGAPAALAFPVVYTITARWWKHSEGRVFFAMALPTFMLYAATAVYLLVPDGVGKDIVRLVFVSIASLVSWITFLGYLAFRRDGLRRSRSILAWEKAEFDKAKEDH